MNLVQKKVTKKTTTNETNVFTSDIICIFLKKPIIILFYYYRNASVIAVSLSFKIVTIKTNRQQPAVTKYSSSRKD